MYGDAFELYLPPSGRTKLLYLSLMGAAYRRKAALETSSSARRAALDRAIECYTELLKSDPEDQRAKAELASTQAEAAAIPN